VSARLRLLLSWITIALLGALGLATPAHAATTYSFQVVVDSAVLHLNPPETGCPAINDKGDIAVRVESAGGSDRMFEILNDGTILTLAKQGNSISFIGRNPSINDSQQVSFAANLNPGGEAIYRASPTGRTTIASTAGAFRFFGFDTSVNDAGRVAFKAELRNNDQGLFTGTGGAVKTIYLDSSSQFSGDQSRPSINDRGQIAFLERLDSGSSGVFRFDGNTFTTIVEDGGPILFTTVPQLNGSGVAVFQSFLRSGGEAVTVGNGTVLKNVVTTSGPFQSFDIGDPSINDVGGVVFTASRDDGTEGVYTGADPVADKVIETGDTLDGSTVTNAFQCSEGLNNVGQVAFQAQLMDGRTVVVKATPA